MSSHDVTVVRTADADTLRASHDARALPAVLMRAKEVRAEAPTFRLTRAEDFQRLLEHRFLLLVAVATLATIAVVACVVGGA